MKVASLFSILAFVANGFSPLPAVTTVKVSQTHVASSTPDFSTKFPAVFAAVSTAMAPLAAHADEVDQGTVVGLGVGLVACIVSLAVGFTIGYGTLSGSK